MAKLIDNGKLEYPQKVGESESSDFTSKSDYLHSEAPDAMLKLISTVSWLPTLATFALQSSTILCTTVQSFGHHDKHVYDLGEELEALSSVLQTLKGTISTVTDVDVSALEPTLLQCGRACKDLEQRLSKCSYHSAVRSLRDWDRLGCSGDDIDGFRRLLAGYKAKIKTVLVDTNVCRTSVIEQSVRYSRISSRSATEDPEERPIVADQKPDTTSECALRGEPSKSVHNGEKTLEFERIPSDHVQWLEDTNEPSPQTPNGSSILDCGNEIRFKVS